MVRNEDDLLALVGDLYAGAADDERWNHALDQLSDQFGGSAIFFGQEGATPAERHFTSHRADPQIAHLIGGPLAEPRANPFLAAIPRFGPGRAILTPEACSAATLKNSLVYRQAIEPFGYGHVLGGLLERIEGKARVVSMMRPTSRGDYQVAEARLLTRLMPHLTAALHLRHEFARAAAVAGLASLGLSEAGKGVILLDERSHLLLLNGEAERILALDDGLSWSRGLVAADAAVRRKLRQLVDMARDRAVGASVAPLTVARPSGARPFLVTVLAAPPVSAGAVMILLRDPARNSCPDQATLRAAYGLTPTEATVTLELAGGKTLNEAAKALGISLNTAKSHLKIVFDKVGVHRQSALVSRVFLDLGRA